MKKTSIIFSVLVSFLFAGSANAQDYKAAIGIRFSSKAALVNNSVSLKYFFTEKTAVEGLITFNDPFALGILVEQHKPLATNNFKYFYGGGFYGAFSGSRRAGLQGVIGLDYKVQMIPLNFSIDWKPELTFTKEFSFEPQTLGLSARFTFK
ncbi:MAG TPA: hypothetical protein VNT20_04600 [Flavisolibacter sp.]|jgi:hypothetical protein|nr:hypothetical protein [Flavisolibacter sp.]